MCVETIYAYVRADKVAGGDLWRHCRHQLKRRKRQVTAPRVAVQNRTMIDGASDRMGWFNPPAGSSRTEDMSLQGSLGTFLKMTYVRSRESKRT